MPPRKRRAGPRKSSAVKDSVFLNIPYDHSFISSFLAYIAGISAYGLIPRATLEIPGSTRRLDRISDLIKSCRYSIHDLSRVELDMTPPPTPRFNMPFELGLAVAHERSNQGPHTWFVFETMNWRLQKSLSDLNGTDVYIHEGTIQGIFRELTQAFIRSKQQPTVADMQLVYEKVVEILPRFLADAGAVDPFQARVFQDISIYASALADDLFN